MTDMQILGLIVILACIVGFGRSCGLAFIGIAGLILFAVWLIYTFFAIFCIAVFCIALLCIMLILAGSERQ